MNNNLKVRFVDALKRKVEKIGFNFSWIKEFTKSVREKIKESHSEVNLKTALIYLYTLLKENVEYWELETSYLKIEPLEDLKRGLGSTGEMIESFPGVPVDPKTFKQYIKEHMHKYFNSSDTKENIGETDLPHVINVSSRMIFISLNVITDKFGKTLERLRLQEKYLEVYNYLKPYDLVVREIFRE